MNEQLEDLPEEAQELLREQEISRLMRREAFAQAMSKRRDEAVEGRLSSGIEQQWLEDAEHYLGIDNANRGTVNVIKPVSPNGGSTADRKPKQTRSTVFLNITRPYVDAIAARTCDILLPTDEKNFAIQPTPIPRLIAMLGDQRPLPEVMQQPPAQSQGMPQGMPQQGQPPAQAKPKTVGDMAAEVMGKARDAAEKAEKRIADWLAECRYNAEARKVVHDAARLGVGVLKGPAPAHATSIAYVDGALVAEKEIKPTSKAVDPWNFFPDPACAEDIHSGQYVWERDFLTAKGLRALKGLPGYLDDEIDKCIEDGPKPRNESNSSRNNFRRDQTDRDVYEIWWGYVQAEKEDLEACGVDLKGVEHFNAIVAIVNDRIIKAAINPIDTGAFPYDVIPWQRVAGHWAGIGVSRQIRAPQQAVNACHRNALDNLGLAGGPLLIIKQGNIIPADGTWELTPRKVFYAAADADLRSVNDAIMAVNIPSLQQELMAQLQFELQMCEQITGFPLLLMGQNGQSTPDTYGGQMLATANASTVLRAIARTFDDYITVPHITRYYTWHLLYGEDDTEKGDFQVVARGSSALVEREIQTQEQLALLQMTANPAFGLDPKKVMAEWFKSRRMSPEKFQYSEEELAKLQQQQQPPPPAVQAAQIRSQASVQVAEINKARELEKIQAELNAEIQAAQAGFLSPQRASAEAQIAAAQIRANAEIEKEKYRSDSELAYSQQQAAMAQANDIANMRELQLKYEIAMATLAAKHRMTVDQVKAQLAMKSIDAATQRQLAAAKYNFDAVDYERDRQQDYEKHAQNLMTNQQQADEARRAESAKQSAQHAHEMELQKQKLAEVKAKIQDAPGKRQ